MKQMEQGRTLREDTEVDPHRPGWQPSGCETDPGDPHGQNARRRKEELEQYFHKQQQG